MMAALGTSQLDNLLNLYIAYVCFVYIYICTSISAPAWFFLYASMRYCDFMWLKPHTGDSICVYRTADLDSARENTLPSSSGTPAGSSSCPTFPEGVDAAAVITVAIQEMKQDLKAESLQIHDVIGRGGFGTVYRGTWQGLNVAVKIVVFQGIHATDTTMRVAAAEASIAYNLTHPNIVATYSHELKQMKDEEVGRVSCWRLCLIQVSALVRVT